MTTGETHIRRGVLSLGSLISERGAGELHGIHVHVRGQPPISHHWTSDIRRDVFSVSKTFVSVAVGLAATEGLLDLTDPLLRHLGHLAPRAAEGVESITIEQLLTMTSGIVYRWDDTTTSPAADPALPIVAAPLGSKPGTSFAYRGGNTYLLSRVIHSCSCQDVRDFLQSRLFAPLGIEEPAWQRCPRGFSLGATGLSLRTGEVARLGRTLLDHGGWQGQQLIPVDYVTSLISHPVDTLGHLATRAAGPHPENARYGRHVWLCVRDDAWRMDGIYGQFSVVLPLQRACITVTGHYRGPTTDILDAIWSEIVPSLA
ncbi:MAG TPA: serine hydrolase [Propionibacteriaceae bacterium]|jgi:CubicO group peptidase (beta-lactamase class C family)